ncbi:MAG: hypothetical protein C4K60_14355 [Ideonella sp. MAG2]|nr:MAG: hypothetical protein C4K60_14355 [Ideonella sp. MAG2]
MCRCSRACGQTPPSSRLVGPGPPCSFLKRAASPRGPVPAAWAWSSASMAARPCWSCKPPASTRSAPSCCATSSALGCDMGWLSHFLQRQTTRRLAGPLAIWGKVPSHSDFINVNTLIQDTQAWAAWVAHQWQTPSPPAAKRKPQDQGWMSLSPEPHSYADLSQIPVAFMLPAPADQGGEQFWRGVLVTSRDRIGRPHPLIVYQRASPRWLRRLPSPNPAAATPDWTHTQPAQESQDLLYWLARVLARWQAHHDTLGTLSRAIASLNQLHAPGLRQLLGDGPSVVAPARLHELVNSLGRDDDIPDAMDSIDSVRHLLSAGQRRAPSPAQSCGFWILDSGGERLRQTTRWSDLWKASA